MTVKPIKKDDCSGCGMCVKICPMDVFRLNEEKVAIAAYPDDCMLCGQCILDCPEQIIDVSRIKRSPLTLSWG